MSRTKSHTGILLDRLKEELRIERDTELAEFLNKAQNTISNWRTRNSRLPIDEIIPICDERGFHVDWNYVIYGERVGSPHNGMQPYSAITTPSGNRIPLFLVPAPAGATSPASDDVEQMISLEELVMDRPLGKVIACRVVGDSMEGAGIESGDIVVVESKETAQSGQIVIATVDGELCIKRLQYMGNRVWLYPENAKYPPMEIRAGMALRIHGVVIKLVRDM